MAAQGVVINVGVDPHEDLTAFQSCPAYLAVQAYVEGDHRWLWQWNDQRPRTADEVIATLRAVAVIEAAREQQPAEVTR